MLTTIKTTLLATRRHEINVGTGHTLTAMNIAFKNIYKYVVPVRTTFKRFFRRIVPPPSSLHKLNLRASLAIKIKTSPNYKGTLCQVPVAILYLRRRETVAEEKTMKH